MLYYSHEYNLSVISNGIDLESYKIHQTEEAIGSGILQDKDYIGMSPAGAVSYNLGVLKPNEIKEFSICIFVSDNKETKKVEDIENQIDKIRKLDIEKELQNTKKYWKKYVKTHMSLNLEGNPYRELIRNIYIRTILLYPLLTNQVTRWNVSSYGNRRNIFKMWEIFILLAKRCNIYNKST